MLYKIWVPGCSVITDADANIIKYSSVENKCALSSEQMSDAISKFNRGSAFKSTPSKIIWLYIFAFVWFFGILYLIDPIEDPDYNSERVFESFLVGWIAISIFIFPITFRNYPSSVAISVYDPNNGSESMSVSAIFLTNDGEKYVFTSPTYMGRVDSSFDPIPF